MNKKTLSHKDLLDFFNRLDFHGDTCIIKPNWIDPTDGSFTQVDVLAPLLECLNGKRVFVVESYTYWRNQFFAKNGKSPFSITDTLEDSKKHWKWLKEQDEWFLVQKGFRELFKKYRVQYINITEEVWCKRVSGRTQVKPIVDERFGPIVFDEFYDYIPQKLFSYKGATLISLAKAKTEAAPFGITASTKNLFGLIPDPSRWKYHGANHNCIAKAMLDIHKVWRSLFQTIFVAEAVYTSLVDYMGDNQMVVRNCGYITGGVDSIKVDQEMARLMGVDSGDIHYFGVFKNV